MCRHNWYYEYAHIQFSGNYHVQMQAFRFTHTHTHICTHRNVHKWHTAFPHGWTMIEGYSHGCPFLHTLTHTSYCQREAFTNELWLNHLHRTWFTTGCCWRELAWDSLTNTSFPFCANCSKQPSGAVSPHQNFWYSVCNHPLFLRINQSFSVWHHVS